MLVKEKSVVIYNFPLELSTKGASTGPSVVYDLVGDHVAGAPLLGHGLAGLALREHVADDAEPTRSDVSKVPTLIFMLCYVN